MDVRLFPLAIALLAVSLAGCSDGGGGSGSEADFSDLQLTATDDTGIIRGIAVTEALQPVAGAAIELVGQNVQAETTSSEDGAFGFDGLAPGTYFVKASKLGYEPAQQDAEVVAGLLEPDVVKILLRADPSSLPSYEVEHFQGFLECSATAVLFFFPCNVPLTGITIGNDDYEMNWNLTGKADWMHVSLVWEPTQPFGTELYFNLVEPGNYDIVAFTGGPSPQVADANETALAPINAARLFGVEIAGNGEQGVAGVELQQGFDAYVVVFHGFTPPEGYQFWRDGEPKPPT
ncbi:MAG TPA: carboxypeptidase-like regulatory domain-containing protein [Candidatus Thermoplasmatota archaeon]|nr:carboxypeptidase-like regulatory domain-containing protein [Candidatus Thermoplasmatota archaeon]